MELGLIYSLISWENVILAMKHTWLLLLATLLWYVGHVTDLSGSHVSLVGNRMIDLDNSEDILLLLNQQMNIHTKLSKQSTCPLEGHNRLRNRRLVDSLNTI